MGKGIFISHKIEERSYAAFVKKQIQDAVAQTNFKEVRAGEIDIVVSELTSNLLKHANGGELLYQLYWEESVTVLELLCLDRGPGMANVGQMARDGVSTTNTLGQGLGAIKRLSDHCYMYSLPQLGTGIYCQIFSSVKKRFAEEEKGVAIDVFSVPKPGEIFCGDGYSLKKTAEKTCILLGDGLGHGAFAHEAAQTAVRAFQRCSDQDPVVILRFMHEEVRKTRGLVATVAVLDHQNKVWQICGVGNIGTRLYDGLDSRTFLPYNGIVGLNIPGSMKSHVLPANHDQRLIMYSDGINNRWDFNKYPGLFKNHPMILAGVLYKDFCRGHDDATILIGKVTL